MFPQGLHVCVREEGQWEAHIYCLTVLEYSLLICVQAVDLQAQQTWVLFDSIAHMAPDADWQAICASSCHGQNEAIGQVLSNTCVFR